MTVGDRLKQARKAAYPPVSAAEFAELLNRRLPGASFSRATVSHMENGRRTIPDDVLRVAAHLFGKPLAWFTEGIAGVEPISVPATIAERRTPFRVEPIPDAMLPIVSRAGAGHWVEPFQCEDFEPVPAHLVAQDCFGVVVDGDSMYPFLHPGDIAVFKAAKSARIGQTVLARNDEKALTVKVYRHNGEGFELVPINPTHERATAREWEIEGVLVAYVRDIGPRRITDSDPNGLRWDPATAPVT